jgi:hypothetical protein
LDPPPPGEVDSETRYQVSIVEDSGMYRSQLQYLVGWARYNSLTVEPVKFRIGLLAAGEFGK